jgi:hypothetical protein
MFIILSISCLVYQTLKLNMKICKLQTKKFSTLTPSVKDIKPFLSGIYIFWYLARVFVRLGSKGLPTQLITKFVNYVQKSFITLTLGAKFIKLSMAIFHEKSH